METVESLIEESFRDFGVRMSGPVVVGCSGGKDSTTLLFFLRNLGFDVCPVIVDIGYASFQASRIQENLSYFGFNAEIIHAKHIDETGVTSKDTANAIRQNLSNLEDCASSTPCTYCSRIKHLLLVEAARKVGSRWIALGHHREDFVVTMLKDYFMLKYGGVQSTFNAKAFADFIAQASIDSEEIQRLIRSGDISTMSYCRKVARATHLVRPLVNISEEQTRNFVMAKGFRVSGSGCSHDVFQMNSGALLTKRELVHREYTKRLSCTPLIGTQLLSLAKQALSHDGRSRANPRALRDKQHHS